jgi:hypothetical protein
MKGGWRQRLLADEGVRGGVKDVADKIQDEVVQKNAVEAVDSGLMTASWRVSDVSGPSGVTFRVHNIARSEDDYNYPLAIEVGNSKIKARNLLLRSIDAART